MVPIFKRNSLGISCINALAGGILITAGLCHIQNEAVTKINEALPNINYPIVYILAVFGYSLILIIEKIFSDSHHVIHGDKQDHA